MKTLKFESVSALIRLAVEDMRRVKAMPDRFEMDMTVWHAAPDPDIGGKCEVCMAGAVMVMTLKLDDSEDLLGTDKFEKLFSAETSSMLRALNAFRVGDISYAFELLHDLLSERGLRTEAPDKEECVDIRPVIDRLSESKCHTLSTLDELIEDQLVLADFLETLGF